MDLSHFDIAMVAAGPIYIAVPVISQLFVITILVQSRSYATNWDKGVDDAGIIRMRLGSAGTSTANMANDQRSLQRDTAVRAGRLHFQAAC